MEHRKAHGYPVPDEQFEGGNNSDKDKSEHEHTQEQLLKPARPSSQVQQNIFLDTDIANRNVNNDKSSSFFQEPRSENPFEDILKSKVNKVNFEPGDVAVKKDTESIKSRGSRSSKRSQKTNKTIGNGLMDEPIQIQEDQLGNQNLNRKSIKRSKTAEIENMAEKRKSVSAAKLKKKQEDRALWIKLWTQNRYQPDTVEKHSSLKDVLQKRAQFNHQVQKHMDKLERRCQIGHKEFSKYKQNWVNLTQSENTNLENFGNEIADEHRIEEKEKNRFTYKQWVAMYEDAISRVKNDKQFFVHGKFVSFSKNSLAIFDNKTKFRYFLVWVVTSKKFETFIISLILFNSALLGVKDYTDINNESVINRFVEDIEPLFTYVFLIECSFKIMAMGLILGRNSYLSDGWNWLDFIVVVTSLLENVPAMKNISGLRTFRLFRPLRSLTTMPSMKLLMGTLLSSVSQLGGIMGLAIFFFMIFAILGVSLWAGRINYRCYETEWPDALGNWKLVEDDPFLCSSSRECKEGAFCTSRYIAYDAGYNISYETITMDSDINELNYGLTNFDNMGSAFLTIFQCITMEGWTKIMNIYEDAYAPWFVIMYFILCVVICSFFLLNLTIAVMLMKYEELDKTQKNSKHNEDLIQLGVSINLPHELITFLINQGSIQIQPGASKMMRQEDSFFKQLFAKKKHQVDISKSYYKNPIVSICYSILMNPYFDSTIIFVIILNTMCLAMDKYPQFEEPWVTNMLSLLNLMFTIIFTAEAVIKMVGLGFKEFNKEKFNQFDLVIVIISIAEMQAQSQDGPGVFSSFRAFRLFKIFRLFRVGDLRILLDSIQFTLTTIGDYVILLLLFIYVFALIGMSFFSGQMRFDENDKVDHEFGEPPRTNFDGLGQSVITIFQVLLGEGWNEIMYQCMRSVKQFWAVYYIALVIFGNIIMLNLFLAILLGNFDKARNYGQKKKVFEAFKEIMEKKSLSEALDIILGDMSIHVKTKILKWDSREVEKVHGKGDTKIAMDLLENKQRFMNDESTLNENLMTRKLAASHIDIVSPKNQDIVIDKKVDRSDKVAMLRSQMKSGLENKIQRKLDLIEAEKELNKPENKLLRKMTQKQMRFARIVEKYRKPNPKIMRVREFNRQNRIFPFAGLQEIIKKQNLEKVKKIDISNLMLFKKQEQEEIIKQQQSVDVSLDEVSQQIEDPLTFKGRKGTALRQQKTLKEQYSMKDIMKSESGHAISANPERRIGKSQQRPILKKSSTINLMKNVSRREMFDSSPKRPGPQLIIDDEQISDLDNNSQADELESVQYLTLKQRVIKYAQDSSLFIFHKDWKIRKLCQNLAETPEVIQEFEKLQEQGAIDSYRQGGSDSGLPGPPNERPVPVPMRNQDQKKKKGVNKSLYKTFDDIVLVLIILSSIMLVIDNPLLDPKSDFMNILGVIDICFTVLFFIEAMIKIIAKGFFYNNLGPVLPYMRSYWNMLDAFVVAASLIDLVFLILKIDMQSLQALKALRALRALRPLRVISKNEGMRLIVNALLASIPSMTNVLLVCSLFILIFAIMGVNFFKGTFYSCKDPPGATKEIDIELIITYDDCIAAGGIWVNKEANFDSTLRAMLTLFIMMTTEGWVDVMNDGVDVVGINKQPKLNANIGLVAFFVAFMIVGSQFIINLFVGVVIDNFNTIKEKEELGNIFVTEQQRSWIEIQKVGQGKKLRIKINEPQNCQKVFYHLVNHKYFEYTITFFILLNTIVMAMKHYRMSQDLVQFSEQANYVFALVFNIEMILKLIGLGKIYFLSAWNKFDMVIVFATDFGLILKFFDLGASFSSTATVIRGFRIMRMFKLIRSSVHMRLILDTVFNILPQVSNVMALIFLLFFIYAALGINLFSGVMLQEFLDSKNNFQSFDKAMIALMKFSTGEDWNFFMFELANTKPYNGEECLKVQSYDDYKANGFVAKQCGTPFSYVFFISFTILVSMLIMNLSVAAVIEGLDNAKKENMGIVEGDEIEILIDMWQDYDPMATGWISMKDLVFLLYELPPPLGKRTNYFQQDYGVQDNDNGKNKGTRQQERYLVHTEKKIVMKKLDALRLLQDLKIKVYTDSNAQTQARVHFVDVFKALIKRIFSDKQIDYKLSPNLNKKIRNQWDKKHKEKDQKQDRTDMTAEKEQAALIITRWARKQLSQQRNTYKKSKKPDNKNKQKFNNQAAQNDTGNRKVERQLQIKEQAQIIFNIINEVDDKDDLTKQENDRKYKLKNKFSWMHSGGDKILHELNEDSPISSSREESQNELEKVQEESDDGIVLQEADQYENDLFGPKTTEAFKQAEVKGTGLKIQEQMQINIMNMEDGNYDVDSKQVYVIGDDGVPKRDTRIENNEKILDIKKGANIDSIENTNYMPNHKYNAEQTKKMQRHMADIERKQAEQSEEELTRQQLVPYYARDEEAFENGGSGNTVAMDERYIEAESFHAMNQAMNEAEKTVGLPKNLVRDQFEQAENIRLNIEQKPLLDIIDSKKDRVLQPAKAKASKNLTLEPSVPVKSALNSYSVTNKEYTELINEEEKPRENTPANKKRDKDDVQKVVANNFFNE